MLLRFILWLIVIYIAGKIIGSAVRYIRLLITPNRHIEKRDSQKKEQYTDVEDVPYEEIPKSK